MFKEKINKELSDLNEELATDTMRILKSFKYCGNWRDLEKIRRELEKRTKIYEKLERHLVGTLGQLDAGKQVNEGICETYINQIKRDLG